MKKFLVMVALLATFVVGVYAQTAAPVKSNVEVYTGFQFSRSDFDYRAPSSTQFAFNRSTDSLGGDLAITGFVSNSVGLTGDLSATFTGGRSSTSLVTLTGGPTVKLRSGTVRPFIRALVGVGREKLAADQLNFRVSSADTSFAGVFGGGIDIGRPTSRVQFRLIQIDVLHLSTFDQGAQNFFRSGTNRLRLGTGVSF